MEVGRCGVSETHDEGGAPGRSVVRVTCMWGKCMWMGAIILDENNDKVRGKGHEAWHARACVSVVHVARRCRRGRRRLTIGSHGCFFCFSFNPLVGLTCSAMFLTSFRGLIREHRPGKDLGGF